jgi:glycosyltransferase involved in cell wall biosynthesis
LLARAGDPAELRSAILRLLGDDSKRGEMSANCRRIALDEYETSIETKRYVELYEEMLLYKGKRQGTSVSA